MTCVCLGRVEATVAPVVAVEPKREAREAQYYPEYFYPQMMPSYLPAPYVPKFNPFYAAMSPYFRQGAQAVAPQAQRPNERFFLSYTTSTLTTFTTTVTSFTATSSLVLLCSASGSTLSAC